MDKDHQVWLTSLNICSSWDHKSFPNSTSILNSSLLTQAMTMHTPQTTKQTIDLRQQLPNLLKEHSVFVTSLLKLFSQALAYKNRDKLFTKNTCFGVVTIIPGNGKSSNNLPVDHITIIALVIMALYLIKKWKKTSDLFMKINIVQTELQQHYYHLSL